MPSQEISLRKSNRHISRLNAVLRTLRSINLLITRETDYEQLISRACQDLTVDGCYYTAWIILYNGKNLVASSHAGLAPAVYEQLVTEAKNGILPTCASRALKTLKPVVTPDPGKQCERCPMAKSYAGRSSLAMAISHEEHVFGVLGTSVELEFAEDPEEQSLFEEIAGDIGFALYKIGLQSRLRQAEERFQILFREMVNAMAVHKIICDEKGQPADYRFISVNPAFEQLTGLSAGQVLGRRVLEVLPETEPMRIQTFGRVALTGEAVHFSAESGVLGRWFEVTAFRPAPNQFACIFRDVTQNRQIHLDLMAASARTKSIIHATQVGLWEWDLATNKVIFSDEWKSQIGYTPNEIANEFAEWEKRVHPDDLAQAMERVNTALRERRQNYTNEFRFRHRDGHYLWIQARASAVLDSNNNVVRLHGVHLDITELKTLELHLQKALKEAEEANRSKDEFLAVMSHELRTPLNAVLGFTSLLLDDAPADSELYQSLKTIEGAGEQQLRLIDNLLGYARLDRRSLQPKPAWLPLRKVCRELVNSIPHKSSEVEIALIDAASPPLPVSEDLEVHCDVEMLERLLSNLLSNACKYTRKGHVHLKLGFIPSGQGGESGQFLFSIEDTGIGISPENVKKLFNPFFQVDASYTRRFEGAGLGLAICKKLCDLLGGELTVESELERGSRFTLNVNLPYRQSVQEENPVSPECSAFHLDNPIKVLVVDDRRDNIQVTEALLKRLGAISQGVISGNDAIKICASRTFDLILMDLAMPGMDGFETTRAIRENDGPNHDTPIIALTADVMADSPHRCREAQMQGFLPKPIRMTDFSRTIREVLKL